MVMNKANTILLRCIGACCTMLLMMVAHSPASAEMADSFDTDISTVLASRAGIETTLHYLDNYATAMQAAKSAIPTETERKGLRSAWYAFLDHIVALDGVGLRNNRLSDRLHGADKSAAFQLAYSAFLTEYRFALEFLHRTERSALMHTLLNEPAPELGLPAGTYSQVKFRFLNVLRASEFSWLAARYKAYKVSSPLSSQIDDDVRYILNIGKHGGPGLTAMNAGKVVTDTMFTAWFPVQKGISEWMGDTKVLRHGRNLISDVQLQALQPRLQPGDILLVRREWYLSNVGLPGYWPHAALYVGTGEERQSYFSDDKAKQWVISQGEPSGNIEKLLASQHPTNYQQSQQIRDGEPPRIVEAISEGVSFTGLKHAAGGDSLVVLRPRIEKEMKARAIVRAFQLGGRPYDFDFNFLTDASLVCTELVYKAYEGSGGLSFPLETVMGRPVLPANRIARQFDEEYSGQVRQLDFVAFYDGDERLQRAVESDENTFRASSLRPKWHIFLPPATTIGSNSAHQ